MNDVLTLQDFQVEDLFDIHIPLSGMTRLRVDDGERERDVEELPSAS